MPIPVNWNNIRFWDLKKYMNNKTFEKIKLKIVVSI